MPSSSAISRRQLITGAAGAGLAAAIGAHAAHAGSTTLTAPPATPASATPGKINQLGIFMTAGKSPRTPVTAVDIIKETKALTADTVRKSQDVTEPLSPMWAQFTEASLKSNLTIRAGAQPGPKGKNTVFPPHTPTDLATYRHRLDTLLTSFRPSLLAVENEEAGSGFVSGTASDYLAELQATIDVAHQHGVPVTNGGVTAAVTVPLVWQDLRARSTADSDVFIDGILKTAVRGQFRNALLALKTGQIPAEFQSDIDRCHELLDGYAKLPLDYVNFHWYIDDDQSMRQTVAYLRKVTEHRVITNEIGQYSTDPAVVTGHITALAAIGVPIVLWFDADGDPAVGLHDTPGTLRPNGEAFREVAARVR